MSRARGPDLLDGGALPRGKLALHIGPPLAPRVEDHRRSAGQVPSPWRRLRLRRPGPHGECSTPPASPTNSSPIQPPQLGGFPGPPSSVKAPGQAQRTRPTGSLVGFHNEHRPSSPASKKPRKNRFFNVFGPCAGGCKMSIDPVRIDSRPASAPRFWALTRKKRENRFFLGF